MLILAEKPTVAAAFADALSVSFNKTKGYYESCDIVITNCIGHLFKLKYPEEYNPAWKKWSFENLPILPNPFLYSRIEKTAAQAEKVCHLLQTHRTDKIVIATDADREGEIIARIVLRESGITDVSNCFRFWVSDSLTKKVVQEGLQCMRPWAEYEDLALRGFARQHADWLIGMNLSPYMTLASGSRYTFSVGRVQTALLAAIAQRNSEVKNFMATPYYECIATLSDASGQTTTALLINPADSKTQFSQLSHYLNQAVQFSVENKAISITAENTKKTLLPPQLLNLTALQKLAAQKFDYDPDTTTLATAQKLYEEYKCLSYPRTPSRVFGDDGVDLYREKFELLKCSDKISQYCDPSNINSQYKHIFDSSKLDSHHALIPLDTLPANASEIEQNIYGLVLQHFFLAIMPPCIYNEKKLIIKNGDFIYKCTVKDIISPGWQQVKTEETDFLTFDDTTANLCKVEIKKKLTTPKKEFTAASILAFMENPTGSSEGKLIGIGTSATRGAIIESLFLHEYLIKDKKNFIATPKAVYLLQQLFKNPLTAQIAKISQTTEWEKKLELSPSEFEKEISAYIKEVTALPVTSIEKYTSPSLGVCPLCGQKIIEGKMNFYCEGYKNTPKCEFSLWKTICGTTLSISDVQILLSGKITAKKKMKKKDGTTFSTKLQLDQSGKLNFVWDKKKQQCN